jgi:urease accessory protein
MGPRTTRIVAQDFLIPPEFQGLQLAERSTAQIGGVSIGLVDVEGQSRFSSCFQQVPLRTLPPFSFAQEEASLVYLLNPTVGLMDGDGHLVEVEAGAGVRAVVTGQAAMRIHPAVKSFATQQWRVRLAPGSQIVALPGPNIPFRGSRYYQRAEIALEGDAQLIWGDVWTPGRYARDEESEFYEFDRLVQELEIRRDGELVFRDRFDWRGPWDAETASWYVGGGFAPACAGLFASGRVSIEPSGPDDPIRRVVLPLAGGDTLIRWCGPTPDVVADVVRTALGLAAAWSGGEGASPWLIGTNNLASTHWFSVAHEGLTV